jgi:hypothetical protein
MGNSRQAGPVPPAYRSQWPPRQTQGYRGISKRGNPRLRSSRFIGRPTLVLHAHRRHVPAQYDRSVCVGVSAMAEPRAMPELLLLRLCRHELVAEAANDHGAPIAIGKGHGDGDHAPLRIVTPKVALSKWVNSRKEVSSRRVRQSRPEITGRYRHGVLGSPSLGGVMRRRATEYHQRICPLAPQGGRASAPASRPGFPRA